LAALFFRQPAAGNYFFKRLHEQIGISILIRYNPMPMAKSMSPTEFRALAEFRYQIRHFLERQRAGRSRGGT